MTQVRFPAFSPQPCNVSERWRAEQGIWKGRPPAQTAGFIGLVRWLCYLSTSVSLPLRGDLLHSNGQDNASALLWGQIRAWLITVVCPSMELPHSPPLLLGVSPVQQTEASGPAAAQRDWEAGTGEGGGKQQLGVEEEEMGCHPISGWRISPSCARLRGKAAQRKLY